MSCKACQLLFELYTGTGRTNRDYFVMTELFVLLHAGSDVCPESWDRAIPDAPTLVGKAYYGFCPICGANGISRERRPNGNDRCSAGHEYPSSKASPHGGRGMTLREITDAGG